jgi:hypothetical protein
VTLPITRVELVWYEGQLQHWLRFGAFIDERFIDRRRRIVTFAAGQVFAFVRWQANDYGTVVSRLDILRARVAGEPGSTVPGVTPGGESLLRLDRWPKVRGAFDAIVAIEQAGIDPVEVAPQYWRHLNNRITCNEPYRPYTRDQHRAWLLRRKLPL